MEFDELETVQSQIDSTAPKEPKPKKSNKKIGILILAAVVVVLIVALVFFIIGIIKGNEGVRASEKLRGDLGKSIAMAEKNSGVTLSTTSEFAVLKDIVDYDYLYESSTIIKVGGVRVPEWAVFVQLDNNDKIASVVYYDFGVLKKNWKGQKTDSKISGSDITYNMTKKEADKIVTVDPLATKYSNDDTCSYLYKYYYVDDTGSGNEEAYYLLVTYNMDDIIRGIDSRESDYISFIFK